MSPNRKPKTKTVDDIGVELAKSMYYDYEFDWLEIEVYLCLFAELVEDDSPEFANVLWDAAGSANDWDWIKSRMEDE